LYVVCSSRVPGEKRVRNKREMGLLSLVSIVARWLEFQLNKSNVILIKFYNKGKYIDDSLRYPMREVLKIKKWSSDIIFFYHSQCFCFMLIMAYPPVPLCRPILSGATISLSLFFELISLLGQYPCGNNCCMLSALAVSPGRKE
jgi:hypothetical protein